jgi:hypothetical protein
LTHRDAENPPNDAVIFGNNGVSLGVCAASTVRHPQNESPGTEKTMNRLTPTPKMTLCAQGLGIGMMLYGVAADASLFVDVGLIISAIAALVFAVASREHRKACNLSDG